MEQAGALLLWHVQRVYLPAVLRLCPGIDSPERLAAIIDFTFNLGTGSLKVSTLRRKINADDWLAAVTEIKKWNKAGGRVLRGLTLRREAEATLI
jgi:lysozyme